LSIIKDTPEEIYLVIEGVEPGDTFKDCHDVTWEAEQINDNDVKYIRADKLAAQEAQATIAKQATRIAALEAHIRKFANRHSEAARRQQELVSALGVSALCFPKPRAIDLKRAAWTIRASAVTCEKCLKILKERGPIQPDKKESGE